eukprot:CAMPEP_0205903928 /NCGR_PEP_ID=MMETSP1325-20131115/404_1 /ASSEMBLY_ACC=CAM_ASM_000708 /TAXON_ID=236786 /ORGANISM="Florenciella sp., Strain RCC1007" /LENGTH=134 /DNA_ID=CAMNT_0053269635 /DNA_START=224 /DNA_END=628 /DNA_ORIENTATION=+
MPVRMALLVSDTDSAKTSPALPSNPSTTLWTGNLPYSSSSSAGSGVFRSTNISPVGVFPFGDRSLRPTSPLPKSGQGIAPPSRLPCVRTVNVMMAEFVALKRVAVVSMDRLGDGSGTTILYSLPKFLADAPLST